MRMRSDLAQLYRKVGREGEAETIEEQLRLLLQTADRPPVARTEIVKRSIPMPRAAPDRRAHLNFAAARSWSVESAHV